ncbi:MAG: hypothetical protein KDE03_03210 [Rhodobacteraceae bacterium]|nr:hypothetical protein [Paracoccaceae bacterium]
MAADAEGRRRIAVALRRSGPERVADLPFGHQGGPVALDSLTRDGRRVRDPWF